MKNSLEYAAEEYFIDLYRQHPVFKGRAIVHFDEDRAAQTNCVVVEATQGTHHTAEGTARDSRVYPVLLDWQGNHTDGWEIAVEVKYRSGAKSTVAQRNLIKDALTNAITQAVPRQTQAEEDFAYLFIGDTMAGDREDTHSLHRFSRRFEMIAKLKGEPVNALSR